MQVSEIMMWRDGGTITFTVEESALAGRFRLQTPFAGDPRPLFRNDAPLAVGGPDETALLVGLREWWSFTVTEESQRALAQLDGVSEWRNLSEDLNRVVPLHRIRDVIRCLEARPR